MNWQSYTIFLYSCHNECGLGKHSSADVCPGFRNLVLSIAIRDFQDILENRCPRENLPFMSVPSIDPAEFCQKWLPPCRDIRSHERGFSSECCFVISELTGYKFSTVNNWLNGNFQAPEAACKYLGLVDWILKQTEDNESITILRRAFIEIMTRNR
jgi:hypothetical protein